MVFLQLPLSRDSGRGQGVRACPVIHNRGHDSCKSCALKTGSWVRIIFLARKGVSLRLAAQQQGGKRRGRERRLAAERADVRENGYTAMHGQSIIEIWKKINPAGCLTYRGGVFPPGAPAAETESPSGRTAHTKRKSGTAPAAGPETAAQIPAAARESS